MHNQLKCYQLTSVGDRAMNQDCLADKVSNEFALFVVADGLGGHHAGEKASLFFCKSLLKLVSKYQPLLKKSADNAEGVLAEWMAAAVDEMAVLFSGDELAVNSHTTCVVLYLDDNMTATMHCGDSRIYRLNEKKVLWRTKDHSLIQKQLDEGEITEAEMGLHPEQNQLTRSINIMKNHQAEINVYPPIEKGETFILCSDGFWEFIKKKDLLLLAAPESGINELKKMAKMMHFRAQGKADNLTVQWVRRV
ncbi:MAG: PP2C family protein-serine/threonine phosphatase [Methylococcaceae bacterium]